MSKLVRNRWSVRKPGPCVNSPRKPCTRAAETASRSSESATWPAQHVIAKVTLLVDPDYLVPTPQPAQPNWVVAVTGNNITWVTVVGFGILPGVSLPFDWLANLPAVGGVFYYTVMISWYNVLNSRFIDSGIGTVNGVIESSASFPSPVPPASTSTLTPATSGTLPGGTLAGYDGNALTTTSESGPGSLYVNFQPTFNSLPLPPGQQLNSTVTFTTSFALDNKTTSELCTSNGCGFSFGSSLDSLQSVRNPVVVYHAYLKNNVTKQVLSLPIGGRNPGPINYTNPTIVNDFGPSGWVFGHTTFYPSGFWSSRGAGYYLTIEISMVLPGASPNGAGYPPQVSMHFDDIGLALRLSPAAFSGNGALSMKTGLNFHLVQGIELGLNVTSFGNGLFNSTTLYAYVADNSRPLYSPPLWAQFGSVTINSSGIIHWVFQLPSAVYYLNSTNPTSGNINLRLAAISPYGNFTLQVSAFAVVRTPSQSVVAVEIQNDNNAPVRVVAMYIIGPNGVGTYNSNLSPPNTLDRWVGGGQTVVIPEAYQWLPNQVYEVTITTNTGLVFSQSFTAPNVGLSTNV